MSASGGALAVGAPAYSPPGPGHPPHARAPPHDEPPAEGSPGGTRRGSGRHRSSSGSSITKSPRSPAQRLAGFTPMPGSGPGPSPALAETLAVHLQTMAATHTPPRRKMSRSAPASPSHRPFGDLSPLSAISPIDLGGFASTLPAPANGLGTPGPSAGAGAGPSAQQVHSGLGLYGSAAPPPSVHGLGPPVAPAPPSVPPVPQISPETRAQIRLSPELQMRALRHSPDVGFTPLSPMTPSTATIPSSSLVGVPAATARRSHTIAVPPRGPTMPPPHAGAGSVPRRSRSRSRVSSSGSETETSVDSDSTLIPGRMRHHHPHSRSQPDLTALRSRLVEGWADTVRREQIEGRRLATSTALAGNTGNLTRRRSHGRKTPPMRPVSVGIGATGAPNGGGAFAPGSILGRHSPQQSTSSVPVLTPIRVPVPPESSESEGSLSPFSIRSPVGGMTGSEDADDDLESADSLSSAGSLTFGSKHRRHVARQRSLPGDKISARGLGLTLDPGPGSASETPRRSIDIKVESIEERLRRSSLLSFRLLAIVPALWGISVLAHALVTGALWHDVWPWGVDFSREALERLIAGETVDEGITLPIYRGDMVLAIAWACLTAHFCFCLTTGLTHRWRNYYSLPSTVTRLVSLQCLCWPATYLTLAILGPRRPLLAWVVIGVTTGCSRTVQMWVTSNVIVDSPTEPGDVTPGPFAAALRVSPPPRRPQHVRGLRVFTYNRRWSWDLVARKVGWKIGALLLVTCAWLFWRLELQAQAEAAVLALAQGSH